MTSPLSLLPRRPCDSRCGREGGEGESAFSCRPLGVFVCWGFRLLSPFWRQSAMQPGRHPGSEEGILGSCSVVRKIMSVPCGAVSGDRSQMQPLLYGRLSFSVENSLPPSQTSSKTFSRYCGSLRLKRGEKGGEKKAFLLPLPLSSSRRISLGCGGGHDRALPHPGDPGLPSRPRPPANKPPSTESLVQVSGGRRGAGPGLSPEPVPLPRSGLAAWRGLPGVGRQKVPLTPGWGGEGECEDEVASPCPQQEAAPGTGPVQSPAGLGLLEPTEWR